VLSRDVIHKSDVGGVALGLADPAAVRAAYAAVEQSVRGAMPAARLEGMLLSAMAPDGIDVIVGARRDPVFGPVVMFGLGGIFVEVLADVALRLAPVDRTAAVEMIRSTRGYVVLAGVRGLPRADVDSLAEVVTAVSRFVSSNRQVESVEINPLRVFESGVLALDAVIVPAEGERC
jgi:acyl-CoA synthetase (NDP forming)